MEVSAAAKSGDGSLTNVGVKLETDKALQLHIKFQCSTAIAKQINPIGD